MYLSTNHRTRSAPLGLRDGRDLFVGISLFFLLMWGGMVVASAAAGTRPDEVLRSVVIIDCTVLLPLLFAGVLVSQILHIRIRLVSYNGMTWWREAPGA